MLSNLNRTEVLILKYIVPCSQSTDKADGYDRWDTSQGSYLNVSIINWWCVLPKPNKILSIKSRKFNH